MFRDNVFSNISHLFMITFYYRVCLSVRDITQRSIFYLMTVLNPLPTYLATPIAIRIITLETKVFLNLKIENTQIIVRLTTTNIF